MSWKKQENISLVWPDPMAQQWLTVSRKHGGTADKGAMHHLVRLRLHWNTVWETLPWGGPDWCAPRFQVQMWTHVNCLPSRRRHECVKIIWILLRSTKAQKLIIACIVCMARIGELDNLKLTTLVLGGGGHGYWGDMTDMRSWVLFLSHHHHSYQNGILSFGKKRATMFFFFALISCELWIPLTCHETP